MCERQPPSKMPCVWLNDAHQEGMLFIINLHFIHDFPPLYIYPYLCTTSRKENPWEFSLFWNSNLLQLNLTLTVLGMLQKALICSAIKPDANKHITSRGCSKADWACTNRGVSPNLHKTIQVHVKSCNDIGAAAASAHSIDCWHRGAECIFIF